MTATEEETEDTAFAGVPSPPPSSSVRTASHAPGGMGTGESSDGTETGDTDSDGDTVFRTSLPGSASRRAQDTSKTAIVASRRV